MTDCREPDYEGAMYQGACHPCHPCDFHDAEMEARSHLFYSANPFAAIRVETCPHDKFWHTYTLPVNGFLVDYCARCNTPRGIKPAKEYHPDDMQVAAGPYVEMD